MLNQAAQCLDQNPGTVKNSATKAGASQERSDNPAEDGWEFAYHFKDGSSILTRGRGRNYQAWVSSNKN